MHQLKRVIRQGICSTAPWGTTVGAMPDTPRHPVRFTPDARDDLIRLRRRDPQIVRTVLSKVQILERDPYAGRPLVGNLAGCRKLVVGDRHWRIVWRVITEPDGSTVVEVSEILAIGPRADGEVYDEVRDRIDRLTSSPLAHRLADLLAQFGAATAPETPDPPPPNPLPDWLVERLTSKAGIPEERVERMSLEEAVDAWTEWTSRPHH